MKRIIGLFGFVIVVSLPVIAFAQISPSTLVWQKYKDARNQYLATGEQKPLLILLTIDPCPYCVVMKKELEQSPLLGKYILTLVSQNHDAIIKAAYGKSADEIGFPKLLSYARKNNVHRIYKFDPETESLGDFLKKPLEITPTIESNSVSGSTTEQKFSGSSDVQLWSCSHCRITYAYHGVRMWTFDILYKGFKYGSNNTNRRWYTQGECEQARDNYPTCN